MIPAGMPELERLEDINYLLDKLNLPVCGACCVCALVFDT